MKSDPWIFGYGSLVWRPAFHYIEKRPCFIRGYVRRFWQSSTDHRGTPEQPGRVVTLIESPGEICWGMAFRVTAEDYGSIVDKLDFRERGGYRRITIPVHCLDDRPDETSRSADAIVASAYLATTDNPNYAGPAPIHQIAEIVRSAHGPSGSNIEYVVRLADALRAISADDSHVFELADLVSAAPT